MPRVLRRSVEVDAPLAHVYSLLGDSSNARKWSVYVHHITPLNADKVPDGAVGSLRRCFVRADETGPRWDEEIVAREEGALRRLTCFHLRGFPLSAKGLVTEQRYEPIGPARTLLTFSVALDPAKTGWLDALKFRLVEPRIADIFERNLENIKALAEQGDKYVRVHPFVER